MHPCLKGSSRQFWNSVDKDAGASRPHQPVERDEAALTVDNQSSVGHCPYPLMEEGLQSAEGSPAQVFLGVPERERINLLCYLLPTFPFECCLPAWKPLVPAIASCALWNVCAQVKMPPPCAPKGVSLCRGQALPTAEVGKRSLSHTLYSALSPPLEQPHASLKSPASITAFLPKVAPAASSSACLCQASKSRWAAAMLLPPLFLFPPPRPQVLLQLNVKKSFCFSLKQNLLGISLYANRCPMGHQHTGSANSKALALSLSSATIHFKWSGTEIVFFF